MSCFQYSTPFFCVSMIITAVDVISDCLMILALSLSVERVAVLCRFLDIGSVTKSHMLKYSLAHAFCCFLASIEDVNPAVATRARLLLDTIKRPALQVIRDRIAPVSHHLTSADGQTCVCVFSTRACVCAWTSSLIQWSGTGRSS